MSSKSDAPATYLEGGDPAFKGFYPFWVDNLADDVTVEGSLLDGAVQGKEAVRSIILAIRSLYEQQEYQYAAPLSEKFFLEHYVANVRDQRVGALVLVTRNAAGKTQHVVVGYRPRSALLLMSRLLNEKFAGAPFAKQFAASEP